jgi:hypothetical protein
MSSSVNYQLQTTPWTVSNLNSTAVEGFALRFKWDPPAALGPSARIPALCTAGSSYQANLPKVATQMTGFKLYTSVNQSLTVDPEGKNVQLLRTIKLDESECLAITNDLKTADVCYCNTESRSACLCVLSEAHQGIPLKFLSLFMLVWLLKLLF